ncbi:MAG: pilus assembly protein N-terminal domain-containing protein [Ramlibacter sp.]|nr:pilus assembly protein N-terminal domain-containing protein [Ramlibacter sp.]
MDIGRTYRLLGAAIVACGLALAGCGGGDPVVVGGALFTTAPAQVTLDGGSSASFKINGGNLPYTASSGNGNVASATVSGGNTLSLTAVAPGTTSVTIVDAIGSRLNVEVTVLAQSQGGTAISLMPDALNVGNCTTRVPFMFTGGVPPYTVLTSNNFFAPVSSPLSLPDGRLYFFADFKYPPTAPDPTSPETDSRDETDTLTVLDSHSRAATAKVITKVPTVSCPSNPLLVVSPESANFRASEIRAFQISGGPAVPAPPTVCFYDNDRPVDCDGVNSSGAGIAKVVSAGASAINVQALRVGSTLMTVETADKQRASVVITVLPQP